MTDSAALPLHPSIVALVSLAANIAANHPKKGLCQLDRLRGYGIGEDQIALVVDIARHIRDEAGQMLDAAFDDEAGLAGSAASPNVEAAVPPSLTFEPKPEPQAPAKACCTPTAKGNACC